jgi:hypothetical protein
MSDYHTFFPLGWRLYILQSYVLANSDVRYNAVWRPGIEDEVLFPNATRAQILSANATLNSEGAILTILQSYVLANGDVRYNAVWQEGTESNTLRLGQTQAQFTASYNNLTSQNQRLYIMQTYVTASGDVLTNSVWRPGVAVEGLASGVTHSWYEGYYDVLQASYRLYILQPYVLLDGSVLYNALLRTGDHEEKQVNGLTYSDFRAMYDSLWQDGWRVYMLNTYVLPGNDVRYDAVWRLGTIDRPL